MLAIRASFTKGNKVRRRERSLFPEPAAFVNFRFDFSREQNERFPPSKMSKRTGNTFGKNRAL